MQQVLPELKATGPSRHGFELPDHQESAREVLRGRTAVLSCSGERKVRNRPTNYNCRLEARAVAARRRYLEAIIECEQVFYAAWYERGPRNTSAEERTLRCRAAEVKKNARRAVFCHLWDQLGYLPTFDAPGLPQRDKHCRGTRDGVS
jgi:hypothetical protein